MLEQGQAAPARDCIDCGAKLAMKLQHVPGVSLASTLVYVCAMCKATLTVPPRV